MFVNFSGSFNVTPPNTFTTQAIGEEGGDNNFTTLAVGEEGGTQPPCWKPPITCETPEPQCPSGNDYQEPPMMKMMMKFFSMMTKFMSAFSGNSQSQSQSSSNQWNNWF